MCDFCEGKAALKATNHGDGWAADEMYYGKSGPFLASISGTDWETIEEAKDAGFNFIYAVKCAGAMKELGANVYVPGSEDPAYFHFNFCPVCGKPMEKL